MIKQFITIAMSYPYQIKSIEAYQATYKKSIEEPAAFWTEIENILLGIKNRILHWNGISKTRK